MPSVSVILPAYNEAASIRKVVLHVREVLKAAGIDPEIIVVVDGATDATAAEARGVADQVIEHPQNLGYGRSLKTGILAAKHDLIAITDADGTYPVERLPEMIGLSGRFHMVVGARTGAFYQGSLLKRVGRIVFRRLSEFAAGQKIPDINSGLRVFRRSHIVPFFPVINSGFSFTTTSTLVFLLNDLFIHYIPIEYHRRTGSSKVRHLRDSLRALQIIVEAILRYNPIKIFLLLAVPFVVAAIGFSIVGLWLAWQSKVGGAWSAAIAAVISIASASVLFGLGCHAVAVMPQRKQIVPGVICPPVDPGAARSCQ